MENALKLDFSRPGIVIYTEKVAFQGIDRRSVPEVRVMCLVSSEALDDYGNLTAATQDDRHQVFNEAMNDIFAAASRKYFAGNIERDGKVLVKTEDLNP